MIRNGIEIIGVKVLVEILALEILVLEQQAADIDIEVEVQDIIMIEKKREKEKEKNKEIDIPLKKMKIIAPKRVKKNVNIEMTRIKTNIIIADIIAILERIKVKVTLRVQIRRW